MPNQPEILDDPDLQHPRPTAYIPEPAYGGSQDPDALDDTRVLSLITSTLVAGRTGFQACVWARGQSEQPDQDYEGLCGVFTRSALDIPPRDPSAIAMWFGADPESRHPASNADDAPHGHPFVWAGGSKGFGHIDLPAWPFPDGNPGAWSNDLVRTGGIDKVDRNAPQTVWGQTPKGWLDELNGYDLRTGKPKDSKPYLALERAAHNIGVALDTAEHEHDAHDIDVLTRQLHRLERLSHTLKHS